ncbi:hypothetical protein LS73_001005 [Helicobacter muridarum]|uniref:Outer membrane beta-barrel protein n=1 Tax=Helicobacter muridarum TaxID=216 RepID=A0A099TVW3_9HELI|nr:hypothetical protein [Helicobacter muridarum]TLE01295.1 hypothetical protein LS73_001005 [Helicobacter muridarum]STQ87163.1 Uncharacterised protein [Helicobacter muridarum]
MKKYIVSAALVSALGLNLAYAGQKGGLFVGVTGGFNFNTVKQEASITNGSSSSKASSTESKGQYMYGARLGYIAALSPKNAFRLYADFNRGTFTVNNGGFSHMTAGGGLDFLHNFGNVFGLFIGGGYNYAFGDFVKSAKDPKRGSPYLNLGFSWTINERFRIELAGKYLFSSKYHDLKGSFSFGNITYNGSLSTSTSAQVGINLDFVF